ncbi:hypothetical protein PHET_04667 [Paragonimus heterotremus]|uniref:DUF5725 domain-containing protein n=1 Tax=Paragonimus heterotremus TaxID=100268 RepID=A0A8J4SZ58_9TREM|nr:hypothetical protein PHET_04667 [Paragonimus heterotremus]
MNALNLFHRKLKYLKSGVVLETETVPYATNSLTVASYKRTQCRNKENSDLLVHLSNFLTGWYWLLPSNDDAINWNPGDVPKLQPNSNPYRPFKVNRFRGRRIRGTSRSIWSTLYDNARVIGASRRPGGPYARPPYQTSVLSTGINALKPYKMMGFTSMDVDREECGHNSPTDATNRCPEQTVRCDYNTERTRLPTSSHSSPTKAHNLVGNPIVILNPKEPREIFIGGIHTVPLPLWAYKKCLTMVRGEPHELGPRLCLRLLQSLFSLHYLVTHNYNGSGGKAPIDPTVMGAVLRQAQIQFGSGYFFTEPMALGKLRDYLNNAFRVMAFRQRKASVASYHRSGSTTDSDVVWSPYYGHHAFTIFSVCDD